VAGAKAGDAPLTLGQPRFWSADSPVALIDTSDADGAEAEAMDAEEVRQGSGSAGPDSAADALLPAVAGDRRQMLAVADRVAEEQPFDPRLAALTSAAAVDHAATHPEPAAEAGSKDQAVQAAAPQVQEVLAAEHGNAADAVQGALVSSEAPPALAQPLATLSAVKAPEAPALVAPSVFPDTIDSDSEGPMPSIDSGPSDSDTDE